MLPAFAQPLFNSQFDQPGLTTMPPKSKQQPAKITVDITGGETSPSSDRPSHHGNHDNSNDIIAAPQKAYTATSHRHLSMLGKLVGVSARMKTQHVKTASTLHATLHPVAMTSPPTHATHTLSRSRTTSTASSIISSSQYPALREKDMAFRVYIDGAPAFAVESGFKAAECVPPGVDPAIGDYLFDEFLHRVTESLADGGDSSGASGGKMMTTAQILARLLGQRLVEFDAREPGPLHDGANPRAATVCWRPGDWDGQEPARVIDGQAAFDAALAAQCDSRRGTRSPVLMFEVHRGRLTRAEVRALTLALQLHLPLCPADECARVLMLNRTGGNFRAALDFLSDVHKVAATAAQDDDAELFFEHLGLRAFQRRRDLEVEKDRKKERAGRVAPECVRESIAKLRAELGADPLMDERQARKLLVACDMDVERAVKLWRLQAPEIQQLQAMFPTAPASTIRGIWVLERGVFDIVADSLEQNHVGYLRKPGHVAPAATSSTQTQEESTTAMTRSMPLSPTSPTFISSALIPDGHDKGYYRSRAPRGMAEKLREHVGSSIDKLKQPIQKAVTAIGAKKDAAPLVVPANHDFKVVGENVYRVGVEGCALGQEDGRDIEENMLPEEPSICVDDEDAVRAPSRLQRLQNSTGFHQMNQDEWLNCCRLFQFDPERKGYADAIPLAGLTKPLFQHQAFGVYWQMKQGRSKYGGGFVADDPGLGKSLVYLAFVVAERQLAVLQDQMVKSRAARDGKHLGEKQRGVCPSNGSRPHWIACPCSADSITHAWRKKEGLRLACVAPALIPYWRSQWRAHVDTTDAKLRLQLLIAHKGLTKDREAKADEDALAPTNINQLKSATQEIRGVNRARANQDRFLIVATPQTLVEHWLPKVTYSGEVLVAGRTGRGKWEPSSKLVGAVFGIAMIDESHEEYRVAQPRAKLLAGLPGRPFCFGYSGTPYGQSPRCLEGVLWTIESNVARSPAFGGETGWEQDAEMMPFAHKKLDVICGRYENYIKTGARDVKELNDIIGRFVPFVRNFVLRRTGETKWHDRHLMQLKPHYHVDVFLRNDFVHEEGMQALAKHTSELESAALVTVQEKAKIEGRDVPTKLSQAVKWSQQSRFRIVAVLPYLATLPPARVSLTPEELQQVRRDEGASFYRKEIVNIGAASPAWQWLKGFVENNIFDKHDDCGREQKLVVLTAFPTTALVIQMLLVHAFPEKKAHICLIHGGMDTPTRIAAIAGFTDELDGRGRRRSKADHQILLGTTRMLGTGFTFVRARQLVLIGADWQAAVEKQAYGRVNRIGQENERDFTYRLINEAHTVERRIVARQIERREVRGAVLDEKDVKLIAQRGACVHDVGRYEVDLDVLQVEGNEHVVGLDRRSKGKGKGKDC